MLTHSQSQLAPGLAAVGHSCLARLLAGAVAQPGRRSRMMATERPWSAAAVEPPTSPPVGGQGTLHHRLLAQRRAVPRDRDSTVLLQVRLAMVEEALAAGVQAQELAATWLQSATAAASA